MTYVTAGVRGNYTLWKELLKEIRFSDKDFMFVIGGFTGNPEETFDLLEELSFAQNVWPVATADDRLAFEMLDGFEKMLKSGSTPDPEYIAKMQKWSAEGGREILDAFRGLDAETKEGILDYLADMPVFEMVEVKGKDYLFCEKGIAGYKGGDLDDVDESSFFADDASADIKGYITVIAGNDGSESIRHEGKVIRIDCGTKLGALRLEDNKEFIVG